MQWRRGLLLGLPFFAYLEPVMNLTRIREFMGLVVKRASLRRLRRMPLDSAFYGESLTRSSPIGTPERRAPPMRGANGPMEKRAGREADRLQEIVSLCKRRGFVFPSSEI